MSTDTTNEEAIFDAAIQLNDAMARKAYLDEMCGGDSTLKSAVEELLRFHDTQDDLLATPVVKLMSPVNSEVAEQPGTVIGRYQIVERIGEGGFGAVYRAEQIEPVRRDVALKIIKPGMDSREIIGRFEAERQALALMSHPNVATVLDAGATVSGRPYFVMELVAGLPIDEFCESRRLSVPDRLRLFVQVCRGVQHAHQKGLVHRDLKPSNLLVVSGDVGEGDSVPMAKVIDFGIAKALHQPANLSATREFRAMLGTPEYMSPEQVTLDGDIDTRADIYALGGVLYKLLTGATPLQTDGASRRSFEDMFRAIREVEPVKPSQRVGWVSGPTGSESQNRNKAIGSEIQPAARILRGDLDWIVMKALEKDRTRRYETVNEFAADVERYLHHEPVSAGPPSRWYRATKFVRRNRILVVASALVLMAIVGGGVAAAVGFVRAESARRDADKLRARAEEGERSAKDQKRLAIEAREQATAEADKAKQVIKLLEELLGAAHPDHGNSEKYTVRELLDDAAGPMVDSLTSQPELEATLRRTIGRSYWHLRDMQRAGPHLERALSLRRSMLAAGDPLLRESQADWALYLVMVSRFAEADAVLDEALPALRKAGDSDALVSALLAAARIHDAHGRNQAQADCSGEALAIAQRVHGERGEEALWVARIHAYSLTGLNQPEQAESFARQVIAWQTERHGADHVQVAMTKSLLGSILARRGDDTAAEAALRESLATITKRIGRKNHYVVRTLLPLVVLLNSQNKRREAEKLAREAVEIAETVKIEGESLRVRAYATLAVVVRFQDREETLALNEKAIALQRTISTQHVLLSDLLENRGRLLRDFRRPEESITCHREALELLRANRPVVLEVAWNQYGWGNALRQLNRLAEAEPLLKQAAETLPLKRPERPYFWLDWLDTLLTMNRREPVSFIVEQCEKMPRENLTLQNRAAAPLARAMIALADGDMAAVEQHLTEVETTLNGESFPRIQLRINSLRAESLMRRKEFAEAESLLLAAEKLTQSRNPFQGDDLLFVHSHLTRLRQLQAEAAK